MGTQIICTKCKSDNVVQFAKEKPKEPEPITMDEYAKKGVATVTNLVYVYTTWVLLCKDCGYKKEFTV
jgi:hypothetical protein